MLLPTPRCLTLNIGQGRLIKVETKEKLNKRESITCFHIVRMVHAVHDELWVKVRYLCTCTFGPKQSLIINACLS